MLHHSVVKRNRIQRDNVFFVICSTKSSVAQPKAANTLLRRDWWSWDADAASDVPDHFRNVVLLGKEEMQIWLTPSLFVPQGSTQGGEITIVADPAADDQ
jgi:hypothetical protein